MNKVYKVKKPEEFISVITDIFDAHKIKEVETLIIALQGDLGAGKTAFTQELGKFLGIKETINSPTFAIIKKYSIEKGVFDKLVHMDAYRIEDVSEIKPLKLRELFQRPKTILCIEWPELIKSEIPPDSVKVSIKIIKDNIREVSVSQ